MIVMGADDQVFIRLAGQIAHYIVHGPDDPLHIDVLADFDARNRERPRLDVGIDALLDFHEIFARAPEPGFDDVFPDLHEENARVGWAGGAAEGFELFFVIFRLVIDTVPQQNDAGSAVFPRVEIGRAHV